MGSNLASLIASTAINAKNNKDIILPEVVMPTLITPGNLKTTYNINPQLANIDRTVKAQINDIDRNTGSSRTALARKQRVLNKGIDAKNELYGNKENIETELYNKNVLNRQSVAAANNAAYNKYLSDRFNRDVEQIKLNKAKQDNKSAIYSNLFKGVNSIVQDQIARIEKRRSDEKTRKAIATRSKDAEAVLKYLFG